jgi:hypothetical protein
MFGLKLGNSQGDFIGSSQFSFQLSRKFGGIEVNDKKCPPLNRRLFNWICTAGSYRNNLVSGSALKDVLQRRVWATFLD